jgi:hypothetical protein
MPFQKEEGTILPSYMRISKILSDSRLFVYGGKDLGVGQLNSMWSINLDKLDRFIPGESEFTENPEWE